MTVLNIQLIPRTNPVLPMSGVPESSETEDRAGTEDRALHVRAGSLRRDARIRAGISDES